MQDILDGLARAGGASESEAFESQASPTGSSAAVAFAAQAAIMQDSDAPVPSSGGTRSSVTEVPDRHLSQDCDASNGRFLETPVDQSSGDFVLTTGSKDGSDKVPEPQGNDTCLSSAMPVSREGTLNDNEHHLQGVEFGDAFLIPAASSNEASTDKGPEQQESQGPGSASVMLACGKGLDDGQPADSADSGKKDWDGNAKEAQAPEPGYAPSMSDSRTNRLDDNGQGPLAQANESGGASLMPASMAEGSKDKVTIPFLQGDHGSSSQSASVQDMRPADSSPKGNTVPQPWPAPPPRT